MYFFKYQPDVKLFLQLCLIDTQNRIKHVTFVDLICTQSKFSFKGTVHSKIFGQQSSISQIIKVYSCSTCKFCSNDEYCVCVCVCILTRVFQAVNTLPPRKWWCSGLPPEWRVVLESCLYFSAVRDPWGHAHLRALLWRIVTCQRECWSWILNTCPPTHMYNISHLKWLKLWTNN